MSFLTVALLLSSLQIYSGIADIRRYMRPLEIGGGVTFCVLGPLLAWLHYKRINRLKEIVHKRIQQTNANQEKVVDPEMSYLYRRFPTAIPFAELMMFAAGIYFIGDGLQ